LKDRHILAFCQQSVGK